jgi:hypothetical protein
MPEPPQHDPPTARPRRGCRPPTRRRWRLTLGTVVAVSFCSDTCVVPERPRGTRSTELDGGRTALHAPQQREPGRSRALDRQVLCVERADGWCGHLVVVEHLSLLSSCRGWGQPVGGRCEASSRPQPADIPLTPR